MGVEPTTFISIDTETTGLSFEDDRVIEFGAAIFIRGKMVHRENLFIQTPVPNSGFAVNQITDEQIASGKQPSDAYRIIGSLLGKSTSNRVCIYNAPFDLSFLAHEFRRNDIYYDFSRLQILDPLVMSRRFYQYQKCRLTDMCERLGIPLPDAHDAAADSEAAGHVYLTLRAMYGPIQHLYMNHTQKQWHRTWCNSFSTWYYRKNNKFPKMEPWPIRDEWMASCSNPAPSLW